MNIHEYKKFKILEVTGVDTIKFLQGLTTADLLKLNDDNNIVLTAFANLKGRIISLCFVKFISVDKLLLSVEQDVFDNLVTWLKKYGMFSKVSFKSDDTHSLFYKSDSYQNHNIAPANSFDTNASLEDVSKLNIINKLATIDILNFEKILPAELNLDNIENVISYTKGCYMGQEVIARMHYKAKLKKELNVVTSNIAIIGRELKDQNSKLLATVINSVVCDGVTYILAVFQNQATETNYLLDSGQTITKC